MIARAVKKNKIVRNESIAMQYDKNNNAVISAGIQHTVVKSRSPYKLSAALWLIPYISVIISAIDELTKILKQIIPSIA